MAEPFTRRQTGQYIVLPGVSGRCRTVRNKKSEHCRFPSSLRCAKGDLPFGEKHMDHAVKVRYWLNYPIRIAKNARMDDDELFLAVLDGGSFRSAAEAAGLDPSRVSRRIAALETELGVKLLNRTTRASAPTEAGTRYAEGVRRLKDARAALLAEVTGGQDVPKGRLRIAAPTDFGARFVAPVLTQMAETYPDLSVDLRLGSGFSDLLAEGIDVAIRIGRLADSALMARRIGTSHRVLVAAPAVASQVFSPEDLNQTDIISYRTGMTEMRADFEWEGLRHELRMPCRYAVNSMTAVREAVLAGRGAHLGPLWAFREDLKAGRVTEVLANARFEGFPIHAVWSPTPYQPAASREFVAMMAHKLSEAELT